ncbi:MAG: RluA family pseudouridine synthase, partial [Terriglobia bacterium]
VELQARAADAGVRLDRVLARHLTDLSRSHIQALIREGRVELRGRARPNRARPIRAQKPGLRLRGGEQVRVEVRERPPLVALPEPIPLTILYEDDDLIALDKPAGQVVHLGAGITRGTVVNALLYHFSQLATRSGPLRPGIVHRLDKNSSGVLLVAKNDFAHWHLARQFQRRTIEKRYLALVHGHLARAHDRICLPVARDLRRRTRMTTRRTRGRAAITDYRVLRPLAGFTLLEAILHTGRTHQLRVHFSALGHPVVGDTLYGAPRQLRLGNRTRPTLNRNFLHAECIRLQHPRTGQALEISAPLPPELEAFLRELVN